jgi:hypothetical protein
MTLLDADILLAEHPHASNGILGEWRLDVAKGKDTRLPRITLIRPYASPSAFFEYIEEPFHHPIWLKPWYDGLSNEMTALLKNK